MNEAPSTPLRDENSGRMPGAGATSVPAKTSVLIIEDNRELAELTKMALEHLGRVVHTASNGAEARALLSHFKPDVVVCDINLPDQSGYEVMEGIGKSLGVSRPPFAFLTGGVNIDRDRCRRLGAATVLYKPCPLRELNELVEHLHTSAAA